MGWWLGTWERRRRQAAFGALSSVPGARPAALAALLATLLAGCGGGPPPPYEPPRPVVAARDIDPALSIEGLLLAPPEGLESLPPPIVLNRLDEFFRFVHPSNVEAATVDQLALLGETQALEQQLKEMHFGALDLIKAKLKGLTGGTDPILRRVGAIRGAQAVVALRHGTVEGRIRARALLEEALTWDPENPLVTVILSRVLKSGTFHKLSLEVLDKYATGSWGRNLVDLERLRAWTGEYQTTFEKKKLSRAMKMAESLHERVGDEPWILLEKARVHVLREESGEARDLTTRALDLLGRRPPSGDSDEELRGFGRILLAFLDGRDLEFARADSLYRLAIADLVEKAGTSRLINLMRIPWDLLSPSERMTYDHVADRDAWIASLWSTEDPILATPHLLENWVFYWNRVASSMLHFSRLRLELTGPETEPGRAVLRFGWPHDLYYEYGQTLFGTERSATSIASSVLDYSVFKNLVMAYDFRYPNTPEAVDRQYVVFQDRGSDNYFTPIDSLIAPDWPPRIYDLSFGGRYYPVDVGTTRFQTRNGSTELLVALETLWPDLTVHFPLSGFDFEGDMEAEIARYDLLEQAPVETRRSRIRVGIPAGDDEEHWLPEDHVELPVDAEIHAEDRGRVYRRRIGSHSWAGLRAGTTRIASLLRLRNDEGRIVAMSADNGTGIELPKWPQNDLAMSDILFAADIDDGGRLERQWTVRPGVTAWGIPRDSLEIVPHGSTTLLPGEDLFALFEIYGLSPGTGVTHCEVRRVVEKLYPDSTVAYSVGATDNTSTLIRYGINWWVAWTGIGLPQLDDGMYRLRIVAFDRNAYRVVEKSKVFHVMAGRELAEAYPWRRLKPETTP